MEGFETSGFTAVNSKPNTPAKTKKISIPPSDSETAQSPSRQDKFNAITMSKQNLLDEMQRELEKLSNQSRFIKMIIDGKLVVAKKSHSYAHPNQVMYIIDMGDLLPPRPSATPEESPIKDYLRVYVLSPKEGDISANRAAFKLCLRDLIGNKASFTAQRKAL